MYLIYITYLNYIFVYASIIDTQNLLAGIISRE